MEEGIIWFLIVAALLLVCLVAIHGLVGAGFTIIPILYFALANLAYEIYGALDQVFSTALLHQIPWFMWMFWGALIGAALGFWTLAPIFGWRQHRRWIIASPFIFMALLQLVCLICHGIN